MVESGSQLLAGDGRTLTAGKLIKSGGAGTIFTVREDPGLVAKIYHPHVDRAVYERKLRAMLDFPPHLPDLVEGGVVEAQIAWPRAVLRDRAQRLLGFAMPLIHLEESFELEHVLQDAQARAAGLPTRLGAKVSLAANLAGVVAELHRLGHHVVDLKPVNVRFFPRSLHLTILDCDGFSIQGVGERFPAPQYTPEYLAPELHGRGLRPQDEEPQDRFALAVITFQLVNFGLHPFSGRPASDRVPTDIPGRIAARCYAYGLVPGRELAPSPASGHAALPADLRAMFDRAFAGAPEWRPSAAEWALALQRYALRSSGALVPCAADRSHEHFAGLRCATCGRSALIARARAAPLSPRPSRPAPPPRTPAQARRSRARTPAPAPTPGTSVASRIGWAGALTAGLFLVTLCLRGTGCGSDVEDTPPALAEPAPALAEPARPPLDLEKVLAVAAGGEGRRIIGELARTDLADGGVPERDDAACAQARALWREKAPQDEAAAVAHVEKVLARERIHLRYRRAPQCKELELLAHKLLSSQTRCRRSGSPSCRGVGEVAVPVLEQLAAHTDGYLAWMELGTAYLVAGRQDRAYAAFAVGHVLRGGSRYALPEGLFLLQCHVPDERVFARVQVLSARAEVAVAASMQGVWRAPDISGEIRETARRELPPEEPRPTVGPGTRLWTGDAAR